MDLTAKYWWTSILGIICIAIMIFLFIDPFSGCHIEDSYKIAFAGDFIESKYRYFDYLYVLQWIALGCLAFILWMWREKLGIDGLGPMHGSKEPQIETNLNSELQGSPNDETKPVAETMPKNTPSTVPVEGEGHFKNPENGDTQTAVAAMPEGNSSMAPIKGEENLRTPKNGNTQMAVGATPENVYTVDLTKHHKTVHANKISNIRLKTFQAQVANIFKKYKKISVEDLAKSTKLSSSVVHQMLRMSKNLYRLDGNGIKSIVTLIDSTENIALNKIYEEISVNGSVREYREAVVHGYKVDAIFLTRSDLYVVSLLDVKVGKNKNVVGKEVSKLNKASRQFGNMNKHLIIAFIGSIEEDEKLNRRDMLLKHCRAIKNLEIRFFDNKPESIQLI